MPNLSFWTVASGRRRTNRDQLWLVVISCYWRSAGGMKKRYVALVVIAGLGLVTIFLLFTLDLSSFWDRVCDAFT